MALGPEGLRSALDDAYASLVTLTSADTFSMDNSDDTKALNSLRQQIEDILYLMTGEKFDFSGNWLNIEQAVQGVSGSWSNITDAEAEAASKVSQYQEEVDAANAVQKTFVDNLVSGVREGGMSLEQVEGLLSETFSEYSNGADIVAGIMAQVHAELDGAADAAEGMGEGFESTVASAEDVNAAISPIISQMEDLGKAYQKAYDEAYESMDGQFKLFEQVGEVAPASIDDMISALKSQQTYMQEYSANLKAAATMGISEGLLAQLSDGSVESAAYLAAIVKDGTTKVEELNTAFYGVEEGKEEFANTVAEMETGFSGKMEQLKADLKTTIAEMDMSADAAAAGAATVQAFADAATGMTGAVSAAYAAVAKAAADALKVDLSGGGSPGGNANGTSNAERGYAWVGERGPELLWFNGGEKVFTNEESAAILNSRGVDAEPVSAASAIPIQNGNNISIEVKPEYNISGGVENDELRGILEQQTVDLRELVEDVLDEIEYDRGRSRYR